MLTQRLHRRTHPGLDPGSIADDAFMRLTSTQIDCIKTTTRQVLGEDARVILFGSRVNDQARGGDVDLMIEVPQALAEPALVAARIASRIERQLNGRHVDVLLKAPNLLNQPIHHFAQIQGVLL